MIWWIMQIGSDWINYILIGMMLIFVIFFTLTSQSQKNKRMIVENPPIKTELICLGCGLKEIRDFKEGDYVGKVTDEKCRRCGNSLKINLIYSIETKKKRRKLFV